MAQHFGIQVEDITLLPIGGVASLRSIPEDPKQELLITIAGPLVNVVIFSLLYIVGYYVPIEIPLGTIQALPKSGAELWGAMLYVNAMMVLFNLIPAFPLDGGRLLRASLVRGLGYVRATHWAVWVGQIIGGMFLVVSLWQMLQGDPSSFWRGVIALVIIFGGRTEQRMVWIRHSLRTNTVQEVMSVVFEKIAPTDSLEVCRERMTRTGQMDFPVFEEGKLVGLIGREILKQALQKKLTTTGVGSLMIRVFPVLRAEARLSDAYEVIQDGWTALPVGQDGEIVGWLSREHFERWLAVGKPASGTK
jgi:stage IV sporulation protein FB